MKRSRIKRKPRRGDRPDTRAKYASEHEACALCPNNFRTFGTWLETHHIFGGAMRVDLEANLIRLCKGCHDRATAGELTKAHCLFLKREMGEFDRDELQTMLRRFGNRRVPEPIEPPKEWRIGR